MKDLGFTNDGKRIVEMSEEEHAQLVGLNHAVEGMYGLPFLERQAFRSDFDFTKTFEVIRAWYLTRMGVNQMRSLLDDIQASMEKK